jgi:hypothetical protein
MAVDQLRAWVFNPAKECLEGDVHFQSRQRTAEAGMDASAPAQALVVSTSWIEFVRVGKPLRITVRCAIHQQYRGALGDSRPADLYVTESGSWKEPDRRLKPQHLLDGAGNQFRQRSRSIDPGLRSTVRTQ